MKKWELSRIMMFQLVRFILIIVIFLIGFPGPASLSGQVASPSDQTPADTDDGGDHYSIKWLSLDLKRSDAVIYIDVVDAVLTDAATDKKNCETNTGFDYCSYKLTANVKEVFKGAITAKTFEYWEVAEAFYKKDNFLGEQVAFVVKREGKIRGRATYSAIENSSRLIEYDVLEKLRRVIDPKSEVDDGDEKHPYSITALRKNFEDAAAVVYADVTTLRAAQDGSRSEAFVLGGVIREVFKGNLRPGQRLAYRDDLLYRPFRRSDLRPQVLFLEKDGSARGVSYTRLGYTEGDIKHDILEKLRAIAKDTGR